MRLTARTVLIFVLFAGALLASVGVLSYRRGRASLEAAAMSEVLAVAVEKEAAVNASIEERLGDIRQLAATAALTEKVAILVTAPPMSTAARTAHDLIRKELGPFIGDNRLGYVELFVVEAASGTILVSTRPGEEGRSKTTRPYFNNGKIALYLQGPYSSANLKSPAMTVSAPVRSPDGGVLAVLVARLDLTAMTGIARRRTGTRQSEDAFLFNRERFLVTQPRFLGESAVLRQKIDTVTVSRCIESGSGVVLAQDYRGVPVINACRWDARYQLGLVVKIDQAEAFAPVRAFGWSIVQISALMLFGSAGIARLLARSVARPLRRLRRTVQHFAEGRFQEPIPESSSDELGLLAREFNAMALVIGAKETQLQQVADELDERVRQSTAELVRAQELAQLGSWEWDIVRNIVTWSDQIFRIFGLDHRTCLPSHELYLACVHPDDRERVTEFVSAALTLKGPGFIDNRILRPDGEVRVVHGRADVVLDDAGNVIRMVGTFQDVTARERVEAALRESEERFRDLFENANDLIQSVDPDGRLLFVNRAWKETLGYTEDDLPHLTMFSVLDDSSKEHCQEMFRRLMAGENVPHMEGVFVGKHGRRVFVEGSVNCHFVDGRPVATRGIFHDVTDRKKSEEQFQRLLESAPDAMVIVNRAGTITVVNSQTEMLFGYPRAELLGRGIECLVPARFAGHAADRAAFIAGPHVRRMGSKRELFGLRSDGSEIPVEISLSPLETEDGPLVISAIRDVTERRRVEAELRQAKTEAEAASRAKSEFLATMSHEIRTPMNGVIGAVGLLLDGELTQRQRELAGIARSSAHSLLTLINDILDISKIEAGKMPIDQTPFDLVTMLEDVGEMFAQRAEDKKIELVLRYAPDARRRFVGDAGRIRQVLVNLVGNAIKFSERGHVLVSVGEGPSDEREPLATLRFAIEDTGIGITPEAVGRLFERFAQADASTTRRFGGTGLGLAICKRLVELMGGEIGVTSRAGEGSTFWFTLPLLIDASPAPAPAPMAADITAARVLLVDDHTAARHAADALVASPARPRFQGRVLVADDNTTNQRVAQLALEGLGCHVELAGNGAEAVVMLQQRSYDLVFMDCEMPELDGFEATREIREGEARLANIGSPTPHPRVPVVAMTAKVLPGDREKCLAAGMDDYLSKPVQLPTLVKVLERWLSAEVTKSAPSTPPAQTPPRAEHADTAPAVAPSGALDRAVIAQLRTLAQQTTPALFVRVLEAFLGDAPKYLTDLHAANTRRDAAALARAAHALKGASLNVGAPAMAEMSRQLETAKDTGDGTDTAALLAQLESEFQRVKVELGRELDQEQAIANTHR
jgi:PAS domain S-box-containing protein